MQKAYHHWLVKPLEALACIHEYQSSIYFALVGNSHRAWIVWYMMSDIILLSYKSISKPQLFQYSATKLNNHPQRCEKYKWKGEEEGAMNLSRSCGKDTALSIGSAYQGKQYQAKYKCLLHLSSTAWFKFSLQHHAGRSESELKYVCNIPFLLSLRPDSKCLVSGHGQILPFWQGRTRRKE